MLTDLNLLLDILEKCRPQQKIVFTNGCFDILHSGHCYYLNEAKKLGDILIIGLNTDDSIRRLKGKNRPVNNLQDRAFVLSSLRAVDYVTPFEDDTPLNLINTIIPDILVKGSDYEIKDIIGADVVTQNGGQVITIPIVEGQSTTQILKRI